MISISITQIEIITSDVYEKNKDKIKEQGATYLLN
jgi:hypothetical protein